MNRTPDASVDARRDRDERLPPECEPVSDQIDICKFLHRAIADYLEMPGLSLTPAQMRRVWALSPAQCTALVDALVTARILRKGPNGTYVLT